MHTKDMYFDIKLFIKSTGILLLLIIIMKFVEKTETYDYYHWDNTYLEINEIGSISLIEPTSAK